MLAQKNKLLIISANPSDGVLPQMNKELHFLKDKISELQYLTVVEKNQLRFKDILTIPNDTEGYEKINILHYIGHSTSSSLSLLDASMSDEELVKFVEYFPKLKLIFLNSCNSKELGKEIIKVNSNISIIYTDKIINDFQACIFSKKFYAYFLNKNANHRVKIAFDKAMSFFSTYGFDEEELKREEEYIRGVGFGNQKKADGWNNWKLDSGKKEALDFKLHSDIDITNDYKNKIKSYYQLPALGDVQIKLSDIYIEPNFKIHSHCLEGNNDFNSINPFEEIKGNPSLHDFVLNQFLKEKNKIQVVKNKTESKLISAKTKLLILLGQPGQGKTSFCYRTIHDLIESNESRPVYYVRLNDIREDKEFIEFPIEVVSKRLEKALPIDLEEAILFLDGLDEIYMSAGMKDEDVEKIISNIEASLYKYNQLQIILTSRTHYLNNIRLINKKDTLVLQLGYLNLDQQKEWLRIYKKAHPEIKLTERKLEEIDQGFSFAYYAMKELINQPILLHLIAIADFNTDRYISRSAVYKILFDKLIDRERKKNTTKFQNIKKKDLRNLLSSIAYTIFIGGRGFITFEELEKSEELKSFLKKGNIQGYVKDDFNEVLKEVLVSFYFQSVQSEIESFSKEKNAIEFLHKSLYEYLAAEYVWNFIFDLFTRKSETKDTEEILKKYCEKISGLKFSRLFLSFLDELIKEDKRNTKGLFDRLSFFFPKLLKSGFIYQFQHGAHESPMELSYKNFYFYWNFLQKLNIEKINFIDKETSEEVRNYIRYSQFSYFIDISYQSFTKINMDNCHHYNVKFEKTIFDNSSHKGSTFDNVEFLGTSLKDIDLVRTSLVQVKFENTDISASKLTQADLQSCTFKNVNLSFSNFDNAKLYNIEIIDSEIIRTNFNNSTFLGSFKASFKNCKIVNTHFTKSSFDKVSFHNCEKITSCNFDELLGSKLEIKDSKLERCYFRYALLLEAKFINTSLKEIYFQKANMKSISFEKVDLTDVFFHESNLNNAKFKNIESDRLTFLDNNLSMAIFENIDIKSLSFRRGNLRNTRLSSMNCNSVFFENCEISLIKIEAVKILDAHFSRCNINLDTLPKEYSRMNRSNIHFSDLPEANFKNCSLTRISFYASRLHKATFDKVDLTQADFQESDFQETVFQEVNFYQANFKNTNLAYAKFINPSGLTVEQLSKAYSLYKAEGIPEPLDSKLKNNYPWLFIKLKS